MKRTIFTILGGIVVGVVLGYLAGYFIYTQRIEGLGIRISNLESEVVSLESEVVSLESEVDGWREVYIYLDSEVVNLESEVGNLERTVSMQDTKIDSLGVQIATQEDTISVKESEISVLALRQSTLQAELSSLQKRLTDTMEITVTQHYNWQYLRSVCNWDLPIELSMYAEYLEKVRPTDVTYWVNMAKDPGDDSHISSMVRGLNSLANQESLTEVQKLYFVITFVQSMTYTVDSVTTPYDEYPRYPIQTLFDRGGDCEDTSILVAALLDRMGYDVALIHLPGHMAVGVAISNSYGSYYEYEKKKYSYLETTGEGFEIGEVPLGFTDLPVLGIYPLRG